MSYLDIVQKVLEGAKGEMNVHDIAAHAVKQRLVDGVFVGSNVDEFAKRLSAALSSSVKRKDSLFVRVKNAKGGYKKGVYKLKRISVRAQAPEIFPDELTDVSDNNFIGRGGEYAVMSELLFRGFNVSLMAVDKGIDIVASNDKEKYFHIQAKTASKSKDGVFQFSIKRRAFEANNSGTTFYIFVLRKDNHCDFVVIPNNQIAQYVALGIISGNETLGVRISCDQKTKKHFLNGNQDISLFVNGFSQIR